MDILSLPVLDFSANGTLNIHIPLTKHYTSLNPCPAKVTTECKTPSEVKIHIEDRDLPVSLSTTTKTSKTKTLETRCVKNEWEKQNHCSLSNILTDYLVVVGSLYNMVPGSDMKGKNNFKNN